jgi:hypothetical protein
MNIISLQLLFRRFINCILKVKIRFKNAVATDKIYIFTPSIVNQLTMYINTNQLITTNTN